MESRRSIITLYDLSDDDLPSIISRGVQLSTEDQRPAKVLADAVVGIYFRKTSTRTRVAFSSGALRPGASIFRPGHDDLQINTGESIEDTGRVLSCMIETVNGGRRSAADPPRRIPSGDGRRPGAAR